MKPCLYLCLSVFICGYSVRASAAPPAVTYLYPAGAQRGTTVEVTAAGTFDPWPAKMWASGTGVTAAPAKEKGKFAVTVAADAAPGVYWLRAYTGDGASGLRPFVVGTLPEVAEKEPNDEAARPQALDAAAVVVNGQLAKGGDVDCFAVPLKKGQTLVAALDANHTLKSPLDGVLQVLSADGFVLDQNNDFRGLDPQVAFTAPAAGRYVVRVFAFPAAPDSTIRFAGADTYVYRLTLTTGGFADFATPLALSRDAAAPAVELEGWNLPPAARRLTPKLTTDPPDQPFLTLGHAALGNTKRVRVEPHPTHDFVHKPAPAEPLAPPFSATARIASAGGTAAVPFTGKKGQPLSIRAESRALGLAVNPVVRVLDAAKKQLARAEPGAVGGDTVLAFTPPADGAYTLAVGDLFAGGGPRHAVLLRVLTPVPDYDLSVAADRFAVPPGKTLDIPVKITRRDGFTGAVEVAAEGLPAGVTFAVKPSAGKPDPATVTVTLTGKTPGTSGAFRLVGRVKGQPRLTRTARAPVAGFDDPTADLWVTVSTTPPADPPPKKKKR